MRIIHFARIAKIARMRDANMDNRQIVRKKQLTISKGGKRERGGEKEREHGKYRKTFKNKTVGPGLSEWRSKPCVYGLPPEPPNIVSRPQTVEAKVIKMRVISMHTVHRWLRNITTCKIKGSR